MPAPWNSLRTNDRSGLNFFVSCDYRINPNSKRVNSYTVRELLEGRFDQNIGYWKYNLKAIYKNRAVLVDLIFGKVHQGFLNCFENDIVSISNFFKQFGGSIDSPESIPIFQNQLLHVSKLQALETFRSQRNRYGCDEKRIIKEMHALKLLFESGLQQHRIGLSLEKRITNKEYLGKAKQLRKDAVNKLIQVALNFINENDNADTLDFTRSEALNMISEFRNDINKAVSLPELNSMKAIHKYFDKELPIGYLYNSNEYNGRNILDFTVETAEKRAETENKNKFEYIKKK